MSGDEELARQAASFRASPVLSASDLTAPVAEAVGPDAIRVLDLACGPGLLLPGLPARGRSVVGVTARS